MAEGKFIAVEGIDGSGITTQAKMLSDTLASDGHNALLTREPTEGPVGSIIGHILRGRLKGFDSEQSEQGMALLFAADRLDHLTSVVEPALRDSIHVVTQRYYLSTLAYQSEHLDVEWIWSLNQYARHPDITIFLSVPSRVADQRIPARWERQRYEQTPNLEKVSSRFEEAMAFLRQQGANIIEIDGAQPVDDVHALVKQAAQECLGVVTPQGALL